MAKIKLKKVEYNTVVPRPKDRTPKGQLIVGKKFEPTQKPNESKA